MYLSNILQDFGGLCLSSSPLWFYIKLPQSIKNQIWVCGFFYCFEGVHLEAPPEVFYNKAVLKNLQYSQENICVAVSF